MSTLTVRETTTVSQKREISSSVRYISDHLRLSKTTSGGFVAYHSLFGNLSHIDKDLFLYLQDHKGGRIDIQELRSHLEPDIIDVLSSSYFLVPSIDEERNVIQGWLDERKRKLSTGYLVQGLQISMSNVCNFTCSYCFADASDQRSDVRKSIAQGNPNLSFDLAARSIEKIACLARENGHNKIAVKFLGREPLINWKTIRRLLHRFDDGSIQWAITTNGSLITEEIAAEFQKHNVLVTVSLDGPATVNDRVRKLKGKPDSTYSLVERGIQVLAGAHCPFGISTVISSATNFSELKGFIGQIAYMGARNVECTLVMQTEALRVQNDKTPDVLAAALIDVYYHARTKGVLMHGDWIDPFHRLLATHKFRSEQNVIRPGPAACSATSHQLSIEPSGDMFPCRAMSLHYGHIDNLPQILESEAYRQVAMRTYYNVPFCQGCPLEGFCQGTCLGSLEEESGDIYSPQNEYCDVYRLVTKTLLEEFGLDGHSIHFMLEGADK